MKDLVNCIEKYVEIVDDEKFILHWKQLSEKLLRGILYGYENRYYEPEMVKIIKGIINEIGQFNTGRGANRFNISTNSVFIHGNRSQVEFEYYGKRTQRELGDIIFILSVVYNRIKFFEKMTINQVKKVSINRVKRSKKVSWYFDSDAREQLYLLSRFPTFEGARNSLIPMKKYSLPDYSGCLGTHGLLYYPGDFALITSRQLEMILSGKNTLSLKDLTLYTAPNIVYSCFPCYLLTDKLIHFRRKYFRYSPFTCNLPIFGNSCISYNAYDFSYKYLIGFIGELIYAKKLHYNRPAFQFLQDLLYAIKRKAERERLEDVLNFISSYSYGYGSQGGGEEYGEINDEGGGIGIVHTTVNLGEGE